jgi:hypothetical protein
LFIRPLDGANDHLFGTDFKSLYKGMFVLRGVVGQANKKKKINGPDWLSLPWGENGRVV